MKSIESLWLKHSDKSAVIFANGPSLHKFVSKMDYKNLSLDFYDATWMGIDYSFELFPDTHKDLDYIFTQRAVNFYAIKRAVPDRKLIIPNSCNVKSEEAIRYNPQDPIQDKDIDLPHKDYSLDKDVKIFNHSNSLQSALHISAYMGFRKIYLIGVDYLQSLNGIPPYRSKNDKGYKQKSVSTINKHREDDDFLISKLSQLHNVKIINIGKML
jgi:hypothetical protein